MFISKTLFGHTPEGDAVDLYTLWNQMGMMVRIATYGARVTELHVPDNKKQITDVVLGYGSLQEYLGPNPYFGAICGRVANRIAGAKYELDGRTFDLPSNNGKHCLHGGMIGFDRKVWQGEAEINEDEAVLRLTVKSLQGDQGFGGNVAAKVTYTLPQNWNELEIEYEATTDQPTLINLTNHSYFNLRGAGYGDVLKHELVVDASDYTPTDGELIPTGEISRVDQTPMDFRKPIALGARIKEVPGGYDCNFALNGCGSDGKRALSRAAELYEPESGRVMEVWTTQPGLQVYTGNFLGSERGLGGAYVKHGAVCLETQHFPDAPHHPNFAPMVLRPGENYRQQSMFRFSAR